MGCAPSPSLFRSFWIGGFESACHITREGVRVDMIAATQHDVQAREDYRLLRTMGMAVARDTVRWHLVERTPGVFDFASLQAQVSAARTEQVEVVWDLCHYGWPEDVDVFASDFPHRFARFCAASARYLADPLGGVPFFTPMNEISFLTWAAGDVGWFQPFAHDRGRELKRQLVRATIAAIDAIREIEPRARFLIVEPLIHVVPPSGQPDIDGMAARYDESQFEALDMLAGISSPELGGGPGYVDVVGVNFYHDNQWEHPGGARIAWHAEPRDPRWVPLHRLLRRAWERHRRPILLAETSHVGSGRAAWIREVADEVVLAIEDGVPVEGICLYPIVNRFEWENPSHWHDSGLWDYEIESDGTFRRVLNVEYAEAVLAAQRRLAAIGCGLAPAPPDPG